VSCINTFLKRVANRKNEKCIYFSRETRRKERLEDLGVDERIIFKLIFKNKIWMVCIHVAEDGMQP
jgi:hypothetical protein